MDTGQQAMVRCIPEFDPSRGVTIGAFMKPRIIEAMQARMRATAPTTAMTHDDNNRLVQENIERWKIEGDDSDDELDGVAKSKAKKKAVKRKAKTAKPEPVIPTARGNALGKLTDQQMKVYDNMRSKNPFTNIEMGKRLGVGEGRIRQIKKDVDRILKQSM
jgi:DNA-directed RNA polymerase specialized sigma subunit